MVRGKHQLAPVIESDPDTFLDAGLDHVYNLAKAKDTILVYTANEPGALLVGIYPFRIAAVEFFIEPGEGHLPA